MSAYYAALRATMPVAAAAVLWTPAQMTTALWLDADDASTLTNTGGLCEQWRDKSGNARHFDQATTGSRPAITASAINSKTAIVWPDTLNSCHVQVGAAFSVTDWFIVRRFRGGTGTAWVSEYEGLIGSPNSSARITGFVTFLNYMSLSSFNNHRTNGNAEFLGATSTNGPSLPMPTGLLGARSSSVLSEQWAIGIEDAAANKGWRGEICEVIATDPTPTAANRERIEGYTAHKWGFAASLPAGHPYKTAPP